MNSGPLWYITKDGDRSCLALYERHYSARQYADGRIRTQFVGPGEHIVLRTAAAGLVRGITPRSIRRKSGAIILDIAFCGLDGENAALPKEDS